jgi:hypothetical protein
LGVCLAAVPYLLPSSNQPSSTQLTRFLHCLSLFNVQVKIFSFFGLTMAMGFVEGGLEVNPT